MESRTHFVSTKLLQHTFALGKKKNLWSKSSNYKSPVFFSLPSHSPVAGLADNAQCLYVVLLYNFLVKLCPCVYLNTVAWSSESLQAASKGKLQCHRLHRILIPYISVSFPERGMTVALPSHVSNWKGFISFSEWNRGSN